MEKLFGQPRHPHTEIAQRDMDLAFAMQQRFEEIFFHLLNQLYERVPWKIWQWQAGARLNSVANGKLFRRLPSAELGFSRLPGMKGSRLELRCIRIILFSNSLGARVEAFLLGTRVLRSS